MFEFSAEALDSGGNESDLQILPSKNHPGEPRTPPPEQPSHQSGREEGTIERIEKAREVYEEYSKAAWRFLREDFFSHWFYWGSALVIGIAIGALAMHLARKRGAA